MNKTIRYAVVGLIALFAGGAFADGVPLFTASPTTPSTPFQSEEAKVPGFVKYHRIALNKNAFQANVVTVTIDGKEYRFVVRSSKPPRLSARELAEGKVQDESTTWGGTTGTLGTDTYGTIGAVIDAKGNVYGNISLPPSRRFTFTGNGVMKEEDVNKTPSDGVREVVVPPSLPASGALK